MNYLTVALILILFFCLCGSREGFIDHGFSGMHKPVDNFNFSVDVQAVDTSNYKKDLTQIPVDKLNEIAMVVQQYITQYTGNCMQPIETIYINKYTGDGGDMYDTRFMFYDPIHFFVVEILAKVLQNDGSTEYMVATISTQVPSSDSSGPSAYNGNSAGTFVEYPEILSSIAPSKDAMDAVVKSLKENTQQ